MDLMKEVVLERTTNADQKPAQHDDITEAT